MSATEVAILVCGLSFVLGLLCFIRYSKSRSIGLLVTGLLLMLILPGVILLFILGVFHPPAMGCYAPPEDYVP